MNCYLSKNRRGATLIELMVSCSMLTALMAFAVPSAIRIGRVQQSMRHDRIAMDELSNQMDRLSRLPVDEIEQQIDSLAPSAPTAANLPDARLVGSLNAADGGYRLVLDITWRRIGASNVPQSLAGWVYPVANASASEETQQ